MEWFSDKGADCLIPHFQQVVSLCLENTSISNKTLNLIENYIHGLLAFSYAGVINKNKKVTFEGFREFLANNILIHFQSIYVQLPHMLLLMIYLKSNSNPCLCREILQMTWQHKLPMSIRI